MVKDFPETEALRRIAARMRSPNELLEEVHLPPELAMVLSMGRGDLAKSLPARALTPEECRSIFDAFGIMVESQQALVTHANEVAKLVDNWTQAIRGMVSVSLRIRDFAQFKNSIDEEEG